MMIRQSGSLLVLLLFAVALWVDFAAAGEAQDQTAARSLRAGIIGLDTSHAVAFTQLLNDPHSKGELAGIRDRRGLSGRQPRYSFEPRSRCRLYPRRCARSMVSRSSIRSKSCSRRWTSCSSKALTGVRISPRSGRCFRPTSRSSSTSRSPAAWPMRSRFTSWPGKPARPAFQARRCGSARNTRG